MGGIFLRVYQIFGSYFTGSSRKTVLYSILALILALSYAFRCSLTIDSEILALVFSSLFQALIALVGLLGVVTVYGLQNLEAAEQSLLAILHANPHPLLKGKRPLDAPSLLTKIKDHLYTQKELTAHEDNSDLITISSHLNKIDSSRKLIITYASEFTVFAFATALLALGLLITSTQLAENDLGLPSVCLMSILTSYSIFLAIKGFVQTLNSR